MNRMKLRVLGAALVLFIFLLALVDVAADHFHLFYLIWWLDIPMHMLGGVWIALVALYLYYTTDRLGRKDHSPVMVVLIALAVVALVGIGWEIFEFVVDRVAGAHEIELGDSLKDLVDDLIGGVLGSWFFIHKKYHHHL